MIPKKRPGRVTKVPATLTFPSLLNSIPLTILSGKLNVLCSALPPSSLTSLAVANFAKEDVGRIIARSYAMMLDELSIYTRNTQAPHLDDLERKVLLEFGTVKQIERRESASLFTNEDDFVELLLAAHRSINAGISVFRNGPMVIRPDDDGNLVVFPRHTLCRFLIESLADFVRTNFEKFPALCAVVAYAGIIHAHPFRDGNGRTARVLFNLLMRKGCGSSHFLPLSYMMLLSEGGFLIKLRRALYGGEWAPLMQFFCDSLRLSCHMQRQDECKSNLQHSL